MEASSTLTPAQVAVVMVEQAVAKHNTRYDKTFFKAVSCNSVYLCVLSHPPISASPVLCCPLVVSLI